jgi:integrase
VAPVLAACWQTHPDFAPVATAIVLGSFRKAEVINLRRDQVDLARRWAQVEEFEGDDVAAAWTPKTKSSYRAVPLHPVVIEALTAMEPVKRPDGTLSPWMFPLVSVPRTQEAIDRKGRRLPIIGDRRSIGSPWFGRCLREALAHAGIERKVTIHGLRRTFAVLLQDAGAPDSVIRQAMGHAPRGVTERHYLPRRDPLVQRWVDRIRIEPAGPANEPEEASTPDPSWPDSELSPVLH